MAKGSKQDFDSYFANKGSSVTCNNMPSINHVPSIAGRHNDFVSAKTFYFENKDRSIFYCRKNYLGSRIEIFDPLFMTADLLYIVNRFMVRTNHYGGMTFRLNLGGGLSNAKNVRGINLYQSESDFSLQHELPPAPFDLKAEFSKIFELYFEALHIDSALKAYPGTIAEVERAWKEYDKKSWENSD